MSRGERLDARAARFALIFPCLVALGLVAGGVLVGGPHAGGWQLPLGGPALPLPLFLAAGAGAIVLLGAALGLQAARTRLPRPLRRAALGAALSGELSIAALFAAALLGQGRTLPEVPPARVDGQVVLVGCGLAAALGVVLALSYQPEERWSAADDAAVASVLAGGPAPAPAVVAWWIHPRGSVLLMIALLGLLPGSLLLLVSPWLMLLTAGTAALVLAGLSARAVVGKGTVRLRLAGLLPLLSVPRRRLCGARPTQVHARELGGWGWRGAGAARSFLAGSGAAVELDFADGGRLTLGARSAAAAQAVAARVNGPAGNSL